MRPWWIALVIWIGMLPCPSIPAQEVPHEAVTVSEAVRLALASHPTVTRAEARVGEAAAVRGEALADFFPRIEAAGRVSRISAAARLDILPGSFGSSPAGLLPDRLIELDAGERLNAGFRLSVTQPLFTGGSLTGRLRAADSGKRLAAYAQDTDRQELIFRVEQSTIAVLRATADLSIADEELADITAHLKKVRDRFDAGAIAYTDVLKTETRLARARQARTSASNRLELARTDLNLLVGRDATAPTRVVETEDPWSPPALFGEALRIALSRRPEVSAASERIATEEAHIIVFRSEYFPRISAAANYDRQRETVSVRPESWEIVGTASWTVWDWGGTRNAVRASDRRIEQAKADERIARDRITRDVREAALAWSEAAENAAAAEAEVRNASENARVMSDRFEAGLATATDVLDAETLLTQARLDREKARFDRLAAQSLYRRALGLSSS